MTFVISDWYWIVNDTNPTTQVYSTASGMMVSNTAAAYFTWLNNGNFGSGRIITNAINNNSGRIRLTVNSTAGLQTGQYFNISGIVGTTEANGNKQITIIDSTTIDLNNVSFVTPYASGGLLQGPTIIDTAANLAIALNQAAVVTYVSGASVLSASSDITLTNPLPQRTIITLTGAASKIILPAMNASNSVPLGTPFYIALPDASKIGNIYLNDGVSLVRTVLPGSLCDLTLTDNSTQNGTIDNLIRSIAAPQAAFNVFGLSAANDAVSPNTKMTISYHYATLTKFGVGSTAFGGSTETVDISLAGPAANGRDQAAAFTASTYVHFWAISSSDGVLNHYIATQATSMLFPAFPSGYTRACFLFSALLDAGGNLETINIGNGSVALIRETSQPGTPVRRGWTQKPTAGQLLVGQTGTAADPAFVSLSGNATITPSGVLTISAAAITNSKLANMAAWTFKGNNTGSSSGPTDFTISGLTQKATPAGTDLTIISDEAASHATKYATLSSLPPTITDGVLNFVASGVNFNSANSDTSIAIALPAGFTRYVVNSVFISGASASISTATCGVFTAAAGGGTAIVTGGSAITITTASENTVNNAQSLTINNSSTQSYTAATLFFRVGTAQGSAATANVLIAIRPVS